MPRLARARLGPLAPMVPMILAALAAVSCSRSPASSSPPLASSPGPQLTVTGWITELEFGKLSVRTTDGRSLIFTLERTPRPVAELQRDMAEQSPIRIAYHAQSGQLVPERMDKACPGPDCPPPYVQPTPFSTPALVRP